MKPGRKKGWREVEMSEGDAGNFRTNLRNSRVALGLSQVTLGNRMGVSGVVISQIELGKIRPGIKMLARIGKALSARSNWMAKEMRRQNEKMPIPHIGGWLDLVTKNFGGEWQPYCGSHLARFTHTRAGAKDRTLRRLGGFGYVVGLSGRAKALGR